MRTAWLEIATFVFSCVLCAAGEESAADWPHVFGPAYDGRADGTNLTWPWAGGQPALLWKSSLGEGYSGMSVADGRLYTQAQGRDGQYIVCLEADTGRLLWRATYNYPWQHAVDFPGPYATPAYCAGRIYFADCYGFAGCLDARNGKSLWKLNLTEQFGGKGTGFGYACSPLIEEGSVFLPVGGKHASVVAVSARDGSLLWRAGDDAASYVPCLPISVQGHRQIVTFLQNILVAQDPLTGKELWRDRWSVDGYDEHSCIPLYQEPLLFCASPFQRGARVLKLTYENTKPKAELVWKSKVLSGDVFSSVLVGGCIYGSDVQQAQANPRGGTHSQFKCVELATGRELWATNAPGHASVLACGDKLLLVNESGFLIVVEANRAGYSQLARIRVLEGAGPCWTPPAVYKGRLLVRNQQVLACYQIGAWPPGTASTAANRPGTETPLRIGGNGSLSYFLSWLDRHQSSAQWDPSMTELALWYASGLGLLAVSGASAWLLRDRIRPLPTFLVLSVGLGIVALPFVSFLADRLVFTWPVACHSMFFGLLAADRRSSIAGPFKSRMMLLLFSFFCVCYYFACRQLFLPSGIGFLCGFVPALLATIILRRMPLKQVRSAGMISLFLLSFSLYFWGSALFIMWRVRG